VAATWLKSLRRGLPTIPILGGGRSCAALLIAMRMVSCRTGSTEVSALVQLGYVAPSAGASRMMYVVTVRRASAGLALRDRLRRSSPLGAPPLATPNVSSPPIAIRPSTPWLASVSRTFCGPSSRLYGFVRELLRIVPPRWQDRAR
jgi:hypothetical protein